ncbi:2, 3 cyclic phosphodiesterase [Aureobasidium pullulans]|uniref:2, 3 cyclic phosphodiesterase n=1 Tax=Aureobasidium pullulans TaxID=5580 RepID=A0AB74JP49_AURPU|nr:2, 3 cyclic phosphodiesterase [Aureobasidium pullulans]THX61117.1 2, 3 cyclic phosphodiesterase [Aureobasidium pullulans]TIA77483.1 2, 3 cyclic phosphodiesterase [Aureobasidium pullulans]
MPGSSLWIIPPRDSSFYKALQTLISTAIPPHFPNTKTHDFIPHVTITSNIDQSSYGSDPQAWLSGLHLPSADQLEPIFVTLDVLEPGDAFVKKLTLRAVKNGQLLELAAACRAEAVEGGDKGKAERWAKNDYLPHLSLMYADLPKSDVEKHVDELQEDCRKAGRSVESHDDGTVAKGGSIVLVDTSKPIDQWDIIAERALPDVKWEWPWSKSRFDD